MEANNNRTFSHQIMLVAATKGRLGAVFVRNRQLCCLGMPDRLKTREIDFPESVWTG